MITTLLGDYAVSFHRMHTTIAASEAGDFSYPSTTPTPHYAMSPMAMWTQIALLSLATGRSPDGLSTTPEEAAQAVLDLLDRPHPSAKLAMTLWLNETLSQPAIDDICRLLIECSQWAGRGIPSTDELAAWTKASTRGYLSQFPMTEQFPDFDFTFESESFEDAHALIGGVSVLSGGRWITPSEVVPAGPLGPSWAVDRILRSTGPDCGLAWDPQLGLVGVTVNRCGNGVFTASVIADRNRSSDEVMEAALRITQRFATGAPVFLSATELDPGDGGWWRVGDDPMYAHGFVEQSYNSTLLPAWSAGCAFDVMQYGMGYWDALQEGLAEEIDSPYNYANANHDAGVSVDADGFVAFAATSATIVHSGLFGVMSAIVSGEPPPELRQPAARGGTIVELEYHHPFAVVVVSVSEGRGHIWQGAPLHVAWVSEAREPRNQTTPST